MANPNGQLFLRIKFVMPGRKPRDGYGLMAIVRVTVAEIPYSREVMLGHHRLMENEWEQGKTFYLPLDMKRTKEYLEGTEVPKMDLYVVEVDKGC